MTGEIDAPSPNSSARSEETDGGMRVALLVTDLERGGTPLRLARLARGLQQAGVEVSVGCLAPPGPVGRELETASISTFACEARSARDLLALRRLACHLRRVRPDLLHATLTHANVAARLVGRRLRIPVLTSTATIEVERRWHLVAERCTAGMDAGHLVNSQALADHVASTFRVPRERIHVVPPSVNALPRRIDREQARALLDLPRDAFIVLWMGRLDPVKRLDVAIRCAEILTDIGYRLLLAGDGPARPHIEQLVRRSSARERIRLLGWRNDLALVLSGADVFLFPSRTEGMPNAVLQAMAFGLPVIGSDIPALRELSGATERVLLIKGDDPAEYAAALRRLHDDERLRQELGRRAADWAGTHLDPAETIRATIAVYKRVLERFEAGHGRAEKQPVD
jgi:glycosyltransferase involved in cell wall biosynthesis